MLSKQYQDQDRLKHELSASIEYDKIQGLLTYPNLNLTSSLHK